MSHPQVVHLAPGAAPATDPAGRGATLLRPPPVYSSFVPVLLCALTLLGWFAVQSTLLLGDRDALQATRQAQQQTVDNAGKLRASLDALAADTQRMADAGNPNAALLVTELRKRGITITVPGAAATPAGTAQAAAR
jgi:hypothetical protein